MSRKLVKFVILFDNTNVLYFPGEFLSGRVIVELNDDTPALGEFMCKNSTQSDDTVELELYWMLLQPNQ